MPEDIAIAEKKRADAIAQEYRAKGYEVSREVELDFFPNFRADIVATKGGEATVVEVKTRTSLWQTPAIDELEKTLHSKPGWTFRLNLVDEREKLLAPEGARPYSHADVQQKLEEAENLIKSGFAETSLIVAWAAAEATLRMLIAKYGIEIKRVTNSAYIIGLAVSEGVISRDDYDCLTDAMKRRNAIAHGFNAHGVDNEFAANLLKAIRRLSIELTAQSQNPA